MIKYIILSPLSPLKWEQSLNYQLDFRSQPPQALTHQASSVSSPAFLWDHPCTRSPGFRLSPYTHTRKQQTSLQNSVTKLRPGHSRMANRTTSWLWACPFNWRQTRPSTTWALLPASSPLSLTEPPNTRSLLTATYHSTASSGTLQECSGLTLFPC